MTHHVKLQTSKDKEWHDESGASIPYNRTTQSERLREKKAYSIAQKAFSINLLLSEFKRYVQEACEEVITAIRKDAKIKTNNKGNYTWYNFDQSIKIEINVNESIRFDDTLIDAAKEIITNIFERNLNGDDFVKSVATEAFQSTNGKLDTKKVLGLKKHSSRISNKEIKKEWDKACDLIAQSVTRPTSKSYFRIWVRDEQGDYQNVDLNFSSIKA
jgi:hypothetical protein